MSTVDSGAGMIEHVDPFSVEYARDYQKGWNVSKRATDGALDRADDRNVTHAWYDGYSDYACGRPKWTYRTYRRNGCVGSIDDFEGNV